MSAESDDRGGVGDADEGTGAGAELVDVVDVLEGRGAEGRLAEAGAFGAGAAGSDSVAVVALASSVRITV